MTTVLIIYDDQEVMGAFGEKLRKSGFGVSVAASGDSALRILKQTGRTDCIVLDIMLSGTMNGFDVLEALKRDATLAQIPVVILTNPDSEAKSARNFGVHTYLVKTQTTPAVLVEEIQKITGTH